MVTEVTAKDCFDFVLSRKNMMEDVLRRKVAMTWRIRTIEKGLTFTIVAAETGVSRPHLSHCSRGTMVIGRELFEKVESFIKNYKKEK